MTSDDDALPIRAIEAWAYCPRQAWYRFVANDDPLNVHMERGLRRHATLDDVPGRPAEGGWVARHVAVAAPELGVAGVLDEVVIADGALVVTEYKASRVRPRPWPGVRLQLAVQHLALREHAARGGWLGPPLPPPDRTTLRVFYADSARARSEPWSAGLDGPARDAVRAVAALFPLATPPPGRVGVRCRSCQHQPDCLPDELPALLEAAR